jgi:hypothetical protein
MKIRDFPQVKLRRDHAAGVINAKIPQRYVVTTNTSYSLRTGIGNMSAFLLSRARARKCAC